MHPSERIKLIIDQNYNGNISKMARALNVRDSTILRIVKDKTLPSGKVAFPLIKLGYSLNWVYEGVGTMRLEDAQSEELPEEVAEMIEETKRERAELKYLRGEVKKLQEQVMVQQEALQFYREKHPQTRKKIEVYHKNGEGVTRPKD